MSKITRQSIGEADTDDAVNAAGKRDQESGHADGLAALAATGQENSAHVQKCHTLDPATCEECTQPVTGKDHIGLPACDKHRFCEGPHAWRGRGFKYADKSTGPGKTVRARLDFFGCANCWATKQEWART